MEIFTYLHVLTLLLFINLLQPTTVVSSFGNETDHLALLKFKESIVADPRGSLNSWNDSLHFCKWRGITCGTRHQRVIALYLPHAGLRGTISPFIGNLSFLMFINLRNNTFSGNIPQQVDHLFRLRHLNLSSNMLEGGVPVNLTFCPKLSVISIGENLLTGKVPSEIGSLMKLLVLNLQKNILTGGISPSLGNLSLITQLSLMGNNLVGNIPKEIGRLRFLTLLAIGNNNLSGMFPPSLYNISSMNILSVSVNKLKGIISPDIGINMPNLQKLALGGNEFTGQIPASFTNASQLQELDISNNNFVGKVPKSLGNLQVLWWLNVGQNNLGINTINDLDFITSLTNCSKLKSLDLDTNNFGGVLPNSVANLSIQLEKLFLGCNQISGTIPSTLENLNNLIVLGLNDNLFTGVFPSSLGKLQKLQALGLQVNRLTGEIPSFLGNLTNLFALNLSGNKLEGGIPPSIPPKLTFLDLSQNRLIGEIPPAVIGLFSFHSLSLSQNSLTGSLPVEVGNLNAVNTLDISDNNLTGGIPEIIGGCLSLEFLSLQGNLFQGIIPSSLASLRGLQYLDLSRNNLSGHIPMDLQRLPFLIYLNLSSNNLEGEVPKEGVFGNTSAISLEGNTKLCGGVSKLQPPACLIKIPKQRKLDVSKLIKFTISSVAGCFFLFAIIFALCWWRRNQKKKLLSEDTAIKLVPKVSYQTLHQATDGFSPRNQIGSGGFGSVYKGILDQEENRVVAVKVLNMQQKGASRSFVAECNALRNIRHRNLVKILTCCSSTDHNGNDFKALVFEYMSNGSLEEWLHSEIQSRSLNLVQRLNIALDVACALCYLHDDCEPQIIHRDIKPRNVLFDDDMVARVSDFGLARLIPPTTDSSDNQSITVGIQGTIGYAAPEYAVGVEPSKHGDVYSYGILVLQLFTRRRPTDEIFVDDGNIHTFVKMALPGRLMQIVDPNLIATLAETAPSTTNNEVTNICGYNNEIEVDEDNIGNENSSTMNTYMWKSILPTLKIGLACSEESPRNRMSMKEVLRELQHVKNTCIGVDIRRERPRS